MTLAVLRAAEVELIQFHDIDRRGFRVYAGGDGGLRREVEIVDAHDFIRDGGEHAALVAEVYPAELAVGVQLQKVQLAADAEEVQTREGEPGLAHEGADGTALFGGQGKGAPRFPVLKGVGAAVGFRQLRAGEGRGKATPRDIGNGHFFLGLPCPLQEPGIGGVEGSGFNLFHHKQAVLPQGLTAVGLGNAGALQARGRAMQHLPRQHGEIFFRRAHLAHFVPVACGGRVDKGELAAAEGEVFDARPNPKHFIPQPCLGAAARGGVDGGRVEHHLALIHRADFALAAGAPRGVGEGVAVRPDGPCVLPPQVDVKSKHLRPRRQVGHEDIGGDIIAVGQEKNHGIAGKMTCRSPSRERQVGNEF